MTLYYSCIGLIYNFLILMDLTHQLQCWSNSFIIQVLNNTVLLCFYGGQESNVLTAGSAFKARVLHRH